MSEKIRWLDIAVDDLEQAVEYVAQHNMNAALKLASHIYHTGFGNHHKTGNIMAKNKPIRKQLPEFNPKISGNFAADLLEKLNVKGILIGRLAVWAWLPENSKKQAYTKDVDIAVTKADLYEIKKHFRDMEYQIGELSIGGINVRDDKDINVDFIDRSSQEWADYSPMFEEAIDEAIRSDRKVAVGGKELSLVSIEYLVAMKLATGERKDEDDAKTLLTESDEINIRELRTVLSKYLGPVGRTRFEIILRDIGHKDSRLTKYQKDS